MPNQRRIERGSVSRARDFGGLHRRRPDDRVCLFIRRGAAAANYAVYCLPDCSTITRLTLNRLPLQHRREGFYYWISISTSKPFCSSHSGCPGGAPTGSSFVLRIPIGDGRSPGLPGPVSHSVPGFTRPCSDIGNPHGASGCCR